MGNTSSNRAIKIEDLDPKYGIKESNLMIIEDETDTKQCTVRELKNSFSGDNLDPSRNYFYTSHYVNDLIKSLNIAIANRAPKALVDDLKSQLDSIIRGASLEDEDIVNEIRASRAGHITLSDRLEYERKLSDSFYMKKSFKTISGSKVNIDGHTGLVYVTPIPNATSIESNASGKILYYSKNRASLPFVGWNIGDNLNDIEQETTQLTLRIPVGYKNNSIHYSCDKGEYYFSSNVVFNEHVLNSQNIKISVDIIDIGGNTVRIVDSYDSTTPLKISAATAFNYIIITLDRVRYISNASIAFSDLMLSADNLPKYVEYEIGEVQVDTMGAETCIYNNDYIFEFTIPNTTLKIDYYDNEINIDTLSQRIDDIYNTLNDKIERCGLLEDYGTYHQFDSCSIISSDNTGTLSDANKEYDRNGFITKKIQLGYSESEPLQIKQALTDLPESLESLSLCFYIDKLTIEEFSDESGISIILCSDKPEYNSINYFTTTIYRSEMVHGWNVIKRPLNEFTKIFDADIHGIKSATISIPTSKNLYEKEIYINSICFNQKMKPTVILSFDGTYEDSNTLAYPYLVRNNIPATILLNSSREIDGMEFDELMRLRYEHGWDIGAYGNIADRQYKKEQLQLNDNYREQYIGLLKNKQYLQENITIDPISYSAPYGNLRPITVPFLKDLGFKIARTKANSCISIFTEKDFAIPMIEMSNETLPYNNDVSPITDMIEYAIQNNVAISLFARQIVPEKKNEEKQLLAFADFKSIVDYISKKVKDGELQVLTMADFYHKCVE